MHLNSAFQFIFYLPGKDKWNEKKMYYGKIDFDNSVGFVSCLLFP